MSEELIKYSDTFLENYSSEVGKLYNKFKEEYHHEIDVKPEDLLGVRSVNISKNSLMVVTSTESPVVKTFDIKTGTIPLIYKGHSRTVRMVSFGGGENLLMTGSWDGNIHVIDLLQNVTLKKFSGMGRIPCVYMYDNYVYAGSYDGDIDRNLHNRGRLIDYKTGKVIHYFPHGEKIGNECIDLVFIPPYTIISGSDDGKIFKWKIDHSGKNPELMGEFKPHQGCVRKLSLSNDQKLLASCSGDRTLRVYDIETLSLIREIQNSHDDEVMDAAFSPDQKFLYSCSFDKQVKKWDLDSGKELFRCTDSKAWVWKVMLFHDLIIAGSDDGSIYFYDENGKLQCIYYNLRDTRSFIFSCPPDPLHPEGSFFTNNKKLIRVTKIENNTSVLVSPDEKEKYFKQHNNALILKKVLNYKVFERKTNSNQFKKGKNSLSFILPLSKQIESGTDRGETCVI